MPKTTFEVGGYYHITGLPATYPGCIARIVRLLGSDTEACQFADVALLQQHSGELGLHSGMELSHLDPEPIDQAQIEEIKKSLMGRLQQF